VIGLLRRRHGKPYIAPQNAHRTLLGTFELTKSLR
jgi:hypothetical protein